MSYQGALPFPPPHRGPVMLGGTGHPGNTRQGPVAAPSLVSQQAGLSADIPTALLNSRRWAAPIRTQPGAAQRCHEFHGLSPPQAEGTRIPLQAQGPRRRGTGGLPYPGTAGKMKCELPAGAAGSWRCRMRPGWPTRRNRRHVCGLWGEAALGNRALRRPGGCILSKSPGPT